MLLFAGLRQKVKLSRRFVAVLAIAAGLLCLLAGVVWRAERALKSAERGAAAARELAVTVGPVGGVPNPGFEGLSAPAVFRAGAEFEGRFYLSGPAGLYAYRLDGALERIYRTGLDLPAAPLGQMAVGTLADSREPELLIATSGEGVLAFDGQRFRQILPGDARAREVTALLPLGSGRLLMGTAKLGLLVYDGKTLERFHSTTNDIYVTSLAGTESELWIGTLENGVLDWRGGEVTALTEAQGLPDRRVEAISVANGAAYVGTPAGVAEVRAGKVARVLAKGRYAHAVSASAEMLFVGQMEGGILRVPLTAGAEPNALRRAIAARMDDASDARKDAGAAVEQIVSVGGARYAVTGGGLERLEADGEWASVLAGGEALLSDRNISALMMASDGRMWIGYFDGGLDIVPAAGGRAAHVENDQVFCVNRIVENARAGEVAVATANGLVLFDRDGHEKQVLTRESGLIANHVTDVALLSDGMVAGTPAGISFLDSTGVHSMYAFQGLVNNHVYALGARENGLMVGTLGGISLVSGGAVKRNWTTANSGLKANWITGFAVAGGGWLAGTYGAGILRMDADGTVTATEATQEGTVINPGAMVADGRVVLAGTLGRGLLVGDATGARWKTITAGLPSRNVTALAVSKGVVYVGTDNGLVEIAEDKL
jgi:ligand-binding sensor domain-containing protein